MRIWEEYHLQILILEMNTKQKVRQNENNQGMTFLLFRNIYLFLAMHPHEDLSPVYSLEQQIPRRYVRTSERSW